MGNQCRVCAIELTIGQNWLESQSKTNNRICNGCRLKNGKVLGTKYREAHKTELQKYRDDHKEHAKEYFSDYREKLRGEVLDHYGRICVECGETIDEFLTLDHKNSDGHETKEVYGHDNYALAKNLGFPDTFQTMCWNCQIGKAIKLIREKALLIQNRVFPNAKYWDFGSRKGFCQTCRIELNPETAPKSVVKLKYGLCFSCHSKYNFEKRSMEKTEVMSHFGGNCACCGEARLDQLSIGHPNEDGRKHRDAWGSGGNMYSNLILHEFITEYELRIECFNCNCGASVNGGICPHKRTK